MPKKLLQRYMPTPEFIRNHKHLQFLGKALHDPNLFHLNRRSASGAMAVGLFFAFVPMPFQMVPAAAGALLFRVNLPISIALVWLTNPLTMGPIIFACYQLGVLLLGIAPDARLTHLDWGNAQHLLDNLGAVGWPLFVGSIAVGAICSLLGYTITRFLWSWSVMQQLRKRRAKRS